MTKDNLLIDQNGTTIKYSSEGPDIDDLEFEEEDVIQNPAKTFEKLLKQLDSKVGEVLPVQKPPKIKKEKKKKSNKRPTSICLSWGKPTQRYKLFGELVRITYTNKNFFSFNMTITINAKTNSVMKYMENTINKTVYCDKIKFYLNKNSDPFIFINSKVKSRYKWSVREFVIGISNGEFTEIKINIS
jgi:hypothetical protein